MFRLAAAAVLVFALPLAAQPRPAQTVIDEKAALIRQELAKCGDPKTLTVLDKVRDPVGRNHTVTVTSAKGGPVAIGLGETKSFWVDKDKYKGENAAKHDYARTGGWYWTAGEGEQKTRVRGADFVVVVRDPAGFVDWYGVTKDPANTKKTAK